MAHITPQKYEGAVSLVQEMPQKGNQQHRQQQLAKPTSSMGDNHHPACSSQDSSPVNTGCLH